MIHYMKWRVSTHCPLTSLAFYFAFDERQQNAVLILVVLPPPSFTSTYDVIKNYTKGIAVVLR